MVKRYKITKKRVFKKRTYKRAYKKRFSSKPNNMGFRPLGLVQSAKLKYVTTFSLDPAIGSGGTYVFSANGCYDPDITSTGHQPYGFDQIMAMYNHYTVVGSKITVNLCSAQTIPMYAGVLLRSDNITDNSLAAVQLEQPGNKMKLIGYGTSTGSGATPRTMTCKFSTRKFFSKSRGAIVEDSLLRGDALSNPAEQAYYHVVLAPLFPLENIATQGITVMIEYSVVFTEPRILGPS